MQRWIRASCASVPRSWDQTSRVLEAKNWRLCFTPYTTFNSCFSYHDTLLIHFLFLFFCFLVAIKALLALWCNLSLLCQLQSNLKRADCFPINACVDVFSLGIVHTVSQESRVLAVSILHFHTFFFMLLSVGQLHQSITGKVSCSWQVSAGTWRGLIFSFFPPVSPKLPLHCGGTHSSPSGARGTPAQD